MADTCLAGTPLPRLCSHTHAPHAKAKQDSYHGTRTSPLLACAYWLSIACLPHREAGRTDEAVQCYTICIQLQFRAPGTPAVARARAANPQAAAAQQAQRLSVAYNNLGGILKMQVGTDASDWPAWADPAVFVLAMHLEADVCQVQQLL